MLAQEVVDVKLHKGDNVVVVALLERYPRRIIASRLLRYHGTNMQQITKE